MTQFNADLTKEHWFSLSLNEQLANVGSEVHRIILRRETDPKRSVAAFDNALDLMDLTLQDPRRKKTPALWELCRVREALADYFYGENEFGSTDKSWEQYFYGFAYAAALERV